MYEISPKEYKKLLQDNITKTYKKARPCLEDAIHLQAKQIGKGIKLDDKNRMCSQKPSICNAKRSQNKFQNLLVDKPMQF